MKKRKNDANSSRAPNGKQQKGYNFTKIFLFYIFIALLVLAVAVVWNYQHKSPFSHRIQITKNGMFGKASVVDDIKNGNPIRLLTYGDSILGGYWNVEGKPSAFTAFDVMELALYAHPDAKTALIIGLGTGLFARRCAKFGVRSDVVEIDPVVVQLATQYFGFSTKGKLYIEDAVTFTDSSEVLDSHQYDIIMHDLFSGDIDTSLYTMESLRKIESSLSADGVFVLNLVGRPLSDASKLVYNTLSTIYKHVRCIVDQKIDLSLPVRPIVNMVFFASHKPVKFDIPPHFSPTANIYSKEWVFTHHKELELFFPKSYEGPILSDQNHAALRFDEEIKREFRLIMLNFFDEEAWKDILNNTATK
eukprot:Phypoly_transcript_12448.p1 GENE.Phypoly_transcript_12448~~Phypoly_transcript_12448.p1  ORF type:complete len:361 (-),score=57.30 Phypoly_transcript_12448:25-1107(-)